MIFLIQLFFFSISDFLISDRKKFLLCYTLFMVLLLQFEVCQSQRMSSHLSYQLLINFKKLDIIHIRQSSFFQIRVTVMQNNDNEGMRYSVPFLAMKSQPQKKSKPLRNTLDPSNAPEIDENNSFLTRKFIIRNVDEQVDINEMCLFKGTLAVDELGNVNRQLRLYVELITFQQSEAEIVTEWQGHTFGIIGASFLPIYFNSYKCTCNLNATIHSVVSSLNLEKILGDGKEVSSQIQKYGNRAFLQKYSHQLESSLELLKKQLILLYTKIQNIEEAAEVLVSAQTYRYGIFTNEKFQNDLKEAQKTKIQEVIQKMSAPYFLQSFKKYINTVNQINYQLWKKLQLSLINQYNQFYQSHIKKQYSKHLKEYHKHKSFLLEQSQKTILQKEEGQLFAYAFENHETFIRTNKEHYDVILNRKPSIRKQILIFVHGYQASSFDMQPLSNYIKYKYDNVICLLSNVNEGRTEQDIEESAHRLAIQVKNFLNSIEIKEYQISFVCHSLGGIIARASLKYLQLYKSKFNHFVSICSPHLGYLYHSSALISTSLWILNKVRKDTSMIQLTMEDNSELSKTYIYEQSMRKELNWFKHIWLFGSKQDEYVPYWSATLEGKNFLIETSAAKIYNQLHENLTKDIEEKIIRCQIVFNQKSKDLSNLIGRTAHIKLLNYIPGIQLFASIFVP